MALRKIVNYLNDDVLRKKSKTVETINDKTLLLSEIWQKACTPREERV